jgi:hypothetical protein
MANPSSAGGLLIFFQFKAPARIAVQDIGRPNKGVNRQNVHELF